MKSLIKYKKYLPPSIYFYKSFSFYIRKQKIHNYCPIFIRKYF